MRQSVAIVVRSKSGKILAVKRRKGDGISLPGGKVEPLEGWLAAAKRELQEETGISGFGLSFLFTHIDEEGWICAYFVCDSSQEETGFAGDLGSCIWVEPDELVARTPWPSGTYRALTEVNRLLIANLGWIGFKLSVQ